MLCVWWDFGGIIHWELLPPKQTVTSVVYCEQLDRVHHKLVESRPSLVNRKGVILLHDNARPHVSNMTQDKICELGWEVLSHPPYSPDMAPTDYHLFRSLHHHTSGKTYENLEGLEMDITLFFKQKKPEFFLNGINNLIERWTYIINNNGKYFIDK